MILRRSASRVRRACLPQARAPQAVPGRARDKKRPTVPDKSRNEIPRINNSHNGLDVCEDGGTNKKLPFFKRPRKKGEASLDLYG